MPATLLFRSTTTRAALYHLLLVAAAGCATTNVSTVPPVTESPPPVVTPPPVPITLSFPTGPAQRELLHDLRWQVVTADSGGSRRDTASHFARVSTQTRPDNRGGLFVDVIASGRSGDTTRVDTLPSFSATSTGGDLRIAESLCPKTPGREISPLLLRQLVIRSSPIWPVVDSLAYRTCVSGVVTAVVTTLTWTEPQLTNGQFEQAVRVSGVVRADSSRTLPMRLAGEIEGAIALVIDPVMQGVHSLSGTTRTHLVASANLQRQVLDQVVTFRATLLSGPR